MPKEPEAAAMSPGVLTEHQIATLFNQGMIECPLVGKPPIDASAFDLPLGRHAWKLKEGQRPTTREMAKIRALLEEIHPSPINGKDVFLFEGKSIYLVELDCHLQLPRNINGRATGKSSIGRLDVITRLITDGLGEYDIVGAGHTGTLHLLVAPQTFSIRVAVGDSLSQLRLFSGPPHASVISRQVIGDYGTPFWHIATEDRASYREWRSLVNELQRFASVLDPILFDLTVDLSDPQFPHVFKAIQSQSSPALVDLTREAGSHRPEDYFDRVLVEKGTGACSTVLDQGGFYILKSRERLCIPDDVAVEVIAISERIGDIRIHYAGFAHPGFGTRNETGKRGTPLIFEVRATDMPTRLFDSSLLARIQLFRMSERATPSASPYDSQELRLSKYFSDWGLS